MRIIMVEKTNFKTNLFLTSSVQMVKASNYNQWTFSLFKDYLKGDVLEVGCGVG
jgi:hypothetical protein